MRRLMLSVASAMALVAALAVGPFGAVAAVPYVYGCTPAGYDTDGNSYAVRVSVYNGSASTAHLTHKILAGTGANLNNVTQPMTSTLPPTHTSTAISYPVDGAGYPGESDAVTPYAVRVVSDVRVAVTLTHHFDIARIMPIPCALIQP